MKIDYEFKIDRSEIYHIRTSLQTIPYLVQFNSFVFIIYKRRNVDRYGKIRHIGVPIFGNISLFLGKKNICCWTFTKIFLLKNSLIKKCVTFQNMNYDMAALSKYTNWKKIIEASSV